MWRPCAPGLRGPPARCSKRAPALTAARAPQRIRAAGGDFAVLEVREAPDIARPSFSAPWRPLAYLLEPRLGVHCLVIFLMYSTMLSGGAGGLIRDRLDHLGSPPLAAAHPRILLRTAPTTSRGKARHAL